MTEQLTQIESELIHYEAELFNASTEYRQLAEDAARKRATYDVQYAQELLKLKGDSALKATVPEREALAVIAVQGSLTSARIAESIADGSKRHLGALQAILSSVQTRGRLITTEAFAVGRQT